MKKIIGKKCINFMFDDFDLAKKNLFNFYNKLKYKYECKDEKNWCKFDDPGFLLELNYEKKYIKQRQTLCIQFVVSGNEHYINKSFLNKSL